MRVAVLVAAAALSAQASARGRSACERLRGRDLAPAVSIKLVRQSAAVSQDGGADLVSCSLPNGPVHEIAQNYSSSQSANAFSLLTVVGRYAAIANDGYNEPDSYTSINLVDLRRGTDGSIDLGGSTARAAALTPNGRMAAIVIDPQGLTASVETFGTPGAPTVLDTAPQADIPDGSLRFKNAFVLWTDAGQPRSAPYPEEPS